MNRLVSWSCKIFLSPIIKRFFIKEIWGRDNIPQKNFILAANHQSHLDELATGYLCLPKRYHFIGQTDQYRGLAKAALYLLYFVAGVIPLNRKSGKSKEKAIATSIELLAKGDSLIIYPEGTRTRNGKMGKGRIGAARIFLESGVPVLPVGIVGTFELLPPGGKLKIKRIVKINIGPPLYFEKQYHKAQGLNKNSSQYKALLMQITEIIMKKIEQLVSQIEH